MAVFPGRVSWNRGRGNMRFLPTANMQGFLDHISDHATQNFAAKVEAAIEDE